MAKSKIEWLRNPVDGSLGYSINPVKGLCPMHCKTPEGYEYCYAAGERGLYKRFKWNPEIRFEQYFDFENIKKPSRIFVGSTMELFGDWVKLEWMTSVFQMVRYYPQHTFIFLTKQPQNLIKWSPFPPNTYIGVSATNQGQYDNALKYLAMIEAPVKFLSFEPLLERIDLTL